MKLRSWIRRLFTSRGIGSGLALVGASGWCGTRPNRNTAPSSRPALEQLEDRITPVGALTYVATGATSLHLQVLGADIQLVNAALPSQVLASAQLSETTGVHILGNGYDVNLALDSSAAAIAGGVLFDGGTGNNTLFGPALDTTWNITGAGSGSLGAGHFARFTGVETLLGAADNEDTFVLAPGASVSLVDGGNGGFDSLVMEGAYTSVVLGAIDKSSGWVTLDGTRVDYAGLEPVNLGGPVTDLVLDLSGLADFGILEDTATAGQMQLRTATFTAETQIFMAPTNSLTIRLGTADDILQIDSLDETFAADLFVDGQDGFDRVVLNGTLNFNGGSLDVLAEAIELPATRSITGATDVSLTAIMNDPRTVDPAAITNAVLQAVGLASPSDLDNFDPSTVNLQTVANTIKSVNPLSYIGATASVTIQGNITATGDITLSAEVDNIVALSAAIADNTAIFRETSASVSIQNAALATDGKVTISAKNSGDRGTLSSADKVVINFGLDTASATLDGAAIDADRLCVTAEQSATYTTTGTKAITRFDGATTASIADSPSITLGSCGLIVEAFDEVTITTSASGNGPIVAALNYYNKDTRALVSGSTVTVSDGPIDISADASANLSAEAINLPTAGADTEVFAGNVIQGIAEASATDSELSTVTSGDITLFAERCGDVTALVTTAAISSGSIATAFAFNVFGWQTEDILNNTIDALLGDPLADSPYGTEVGSGATAKLSDTTVSAAGLLGVGSETSALIAAEVTNNATGPQGTPNIDLGAVASLNKVTSKATSLVTFTSPGANTIAAVDGVGVGAVDLATIDATVTLVSINETNPINSSNDVKSATVAGAVAINDVSIGADATVSNSNVTGGALAIMANEAAAVTATGSLKAKASGDDFGNGTSLASGGLIATNLVRSNAAALLTGSTVEVAGTTDVLASDMAEIGATLTNHAVNDEDVPFTAANNLATTLAFNAIGWEAEGVLFQAIDDILADPLVSNALGAQLSNGPSATVLDTTIDAGGAVSVASVAEGLVDASITNTTDSTALGIPSGGRSLGASVLSLGMVMALNRVNSRSDAGVTFSPSFVHPAGAPDISCSDLSVVATDNADISATINVTASSLVIDPTGQNPRASAVAGTVALNDVRGGAQALVTAATVDVTTDAMLVWAVETAILTATVLSEAEAIAATAAHGTSNAVGGLIAANLSLSNAEAYVTDSALTTQSAADGDIDIEALRSTDVTATIDGQLTTNGPSIGYTLAFNSSGYQSHDFLFSPIDSSASGTFGTKDASLVQARSTNSTLDAAGDLTISSDSGSDISATVNSSLITINPSIGDSSVSALSIGAMIAKNIEATDASAQLIGSGDDDTATAASVSILSTDSSITTANELSNAVLVTGSVVAGGLTVTIGDGIARNGIDNEFLAAIDGMKQVVTTDGALILNATQATADAQTDADAIGTSVSASKTGGSVTFNGGAAAEFDDVAGLVQSMIRITTALLGDAPPIVVNGPVDLAGIDLELAPSAVGASPSITLIENDDGDGVVGTFNGLPEGSAVNAAGNSFRISYVGDSGNDVVIERVFANLLSKAITVGTPITTFSGTLVPDSTVPTGSVIVTISGNGITPVSSLPAVVDGNGNFTATVITASLPLTPTTPFTVTYDYSGDANFPPATDNSTTLTVRETTSIAAADFDKDGNKDLLWRNQSNGQVWIWRLNGTQLQTTNTYIQIGTSPVGADWQIVGTGDFGKDGNQDILWRQQSTNQIWIWRLNGTQPQAVNPYLQIGTANGDSDWQIGGVADFDKDGNQDILWRQQSTNQIWIWRLNGTQPQAVNPYVQIGTANGGSDWVIAGAADFDKDGNQDLLWRQQSTGQVWVWRLNGTQLQATNTYVQISTAPAGNDWQIGGTGDFGNDGNQDILWRQQSTGQLWIWRLFGTQLDATTQIGISTTDGDWQFG